MESIDLFIYINLDSREDRRKLMELEFERIGIDRNKIQRFSAIENRERPDVGCTMSHLKVAEHILTLSDDIQNIIIFEDDFSFIDDIELIRKSLLEVFNYDWDLVLLAYIIKKRKDYNELLSQSFLSSGAAGYLIKRKYLSKLIKNYKEGLPLLESTGEHWKYMNDVYWNRLALVDKWFYFNKPLGHQRESYSDLARKIVSNPSFLDIE